MGYESYVNPVSGIFALSIFPKCQMSFVLNVVKSQESSGDLGRIVEINWTQMSFELSVVKSWEPIGILL